VKFARGKTRAGLIACSDSSENPHDSCLGWTPCDCHQDRNL